MVGFKLHLLSRSARLAIGTFFSILGTTTLLGGMLAADALARDGVVATDAIAPSLDPHKNLGSAGALFSSNVFNSLIGVNQTPKDGRGRHIPELATAWNVAKDGKSIEFTLRQNVFFHNGQAVTAEDVKFSIERAIAPETKNPMRSSWLNNIVSADVLSPTRVAIRLSNPWAGTLDAIAARGQIVPKAYLAEVGDAGFVKQPIGTGPFAFVSMRPGDRIEFKAFDRYWEGKSQFDKLTWRAISDVNTRVAMLASGEADAITDVPPSLVGLVRSNGGQVVNLRGGFQRFFFINNMRGGPLADQRVRMALNISVDRNAVFKAIFGGEVPMLNGPLSSHQIGGDSVKPYPYDPERARKLLADAGYPNGFSTELIYTPGRFADEGELLPSFASYWKRVGITVALKPLEYQQWLETASKKAYPAMLSFSKGAGIVADPLSAFDRHVNCDSLYSSYCNKELSALVNSSRGIIDPKRLTEIFSRAQRMAQEDAAQVFLYDLPFIMAWKKGLTWRSEYGTDLNGSWLLLTDADAKK
ncbi:MAG: ABC transporter substrate-binding protein [Burkholderiales bacterium]